MNLGSGILAIQGLNEYLGYSVVPGVSFVPGMESLPADHNPVTLPSSPLVKSRTTGLKVRIVFRQGVKRVTLQRYLVTKLINFTGTVNLVELIVLYENLLWMNAKSHSQKEFREKFGKTIEVLNQVLSTNPIGNRLENIHKVAQILKEKIPPSFLYPERNMSTVAEHLRDSVFLVDGELGQPNSTLPPKRVIGKGYRDHGCLRDQAWDGSPHWTEVAMAHLDLLENENELS